MSDTVKAPRKMVIAIVVLLTMSFVFGLIAFAVQPLHYVAGSCFFVSFLLACCLPCRPMDYEFRGRSKSVRCAHVTTVILVITTFALLIAASGTTAAGVYTYAKDQNLTNEQMAEQIRQNGQIMHEETQDAVTGLAVAVLVFAIFTDIGALVCLILSAGLLCRINGNTNCWC